MIDKWLTLGITVDQAQAFRLIEDACRDAGDYGFFGRVRDELRRGASAADVLRRYEVRDAGRRDV